MKAKKLNSDEKILQQHGITQPVNVALSRTKLSSWTTLKTGKSISTQLESRTLPLIKGCESHCDLEEKLLKLHEITKQVRIRLHRIKLKGSTSESTFGNPKKREMKMSISILDDMLRKKHGVRKQVSVFLYRVSIDARTIDYRPPESRKGNADVRPFKCNECSKGFKRPHHLKRHEAIHLAREDKKFACSFPGCCWKFRYRYDLKSHGKTHKDEKLHKCSICGWKSRWSGSVKVHMQHHGIGAKRHSCEKCDFATKSWCYLKKHIKRSHPDPEGNVNIIQPYKCSHCNYSTFSNRRMKDHLNSHLKIKPFSCSLCDYKCVAKNYLNIHMRTHTGEKPYYCLKCNYEASSRTLVIAHHKVHHESRVRNQKCSQCQKTFFTSQDLKAHAVTHTGEKPFACRFCNRNFARRATNYSHERICKKRPKELFIKKYSCQFCRREFPFGVNRRMHEIVCKKRPDGLRIKSLKCRFCDELFVHRPYRRRHETLDCKLRPEVMT